MKDLANRVRPYANLRLRPSCKTTQVLSPSLVLGYHCVTPFHIPEALGCPATLN
jgi:hypothetical protein